MPFVRVRVDGCSRKNEQKWLKNVDDSLHEIDPRFLELVCPNERSIRAREQPNVIALVAELVNGRHSGTVDVGLMWLVSDGHRI